MGALHALGHELTSPLPRWYTLTTKVFSCQRGSVLRRVKSQATVLESVGEFRHFRSSGKYCKVQELVLECGHSTRVRKLRANQKQTHWECDRCKIPTRESIRPTSTPEDIARDLFVFGRDKPSAALVHVLRHAPETWFELKRILDPNYVRANYATLEISGLT